MEMGSKEKERAEGKTAEQKQPSHPELSLTAKAKQRNAKKSGKPQHTFGGIALESAYRKDKRRKRRLLRNTNTRAATKDKESNWKAAFEVEGRCGSTWHLQRQR